MTLRLCVCLSSFLLFFLTFFLSPSSFHHFFSISNAASHSSSNSRSLLLCFSFLPAVGCQQDGQTALDIATQKGHTEVAAFLKVRACVFVSVCVKDGEACVRPALWRRQRRVQVRRQLASPPVNLFTYLCSSFSSSSTPFFYSSLSSISSFLSFSSTHFSFPSLFPSLSAPSPLFSLPFFYNTAT